MKDAIEVLRRAEGEAEEDEGQVNVTARQFQLHTT
jgi:hypothetical protein